MKNPQRTSALLEVPGSGPNHKTGKKSGNIGENSWKFDFFRNFKTLMFLFLCLRGIELSWLKLHSSYYLEVLFTKKVPNYFKYLEQ